MTRLTTYIRTLAVLLAAVLMSSCIEPKLRLPAQEVIVDMPIVITDLELVWNIDPDWKKHWYYGWDETDEMIFGKWEYPAPRTYEVRRYFLGEVPGVKHTTVDPFTIDRTTFRRTYTFGFYDMLIWSNIYSPEGEQVVTIDESDLDEVRASTTITRSISLNSVSSKATALFNQPEPFYSAYPQAIKISHYKEDYDYFDEEARVWVKKIKADMQPLVYVYLVQIILTNNDGRVKGVTGECAISAFATGTSVNTGHTTNEPCMVYFNSRMKKGMDYEGQTVDIIGGRLTTYGLCDMDGYLVDTRAQYTGTRGDLPNYLFYELQMASGNVKTFQVEVTDQCQAQAHGGVITIIVDASKIDDEDPGKGGSIFNPVVGDYDEVVVDIPM